MRLRYFIVPLLIVSSCIYGHGHHHAEHFDECDHECDHDHEGESVLHLSPEQIKNAAIETSVAGAGIIRQTTVISGRIKVDPKKFAQVVTKVGGIVTGVYKHVGEKVEAGELLATVESKEMAEVKSLYLASFRQNSLAQNSLKRERILYEKKINSEQEFLEAEAHAEEALINYELAKQKLYALGFRDQDLQDLLSQPGSGLQNYEIRSPFEGVVEESHLVNGQAVDTSTDAFHIANLNTVLVEIGIYSCDANIIKRGQFIEIINDNGKVAKARIERISPTVDSETGCIMAIALIGNKTGDWRPGSYIKGRATLSVEKANVVIPHDAVVNIDNDHYVFVVHEEGFEKRAVTIGKKDDDHVAILSGLNPGEEYASKNAMILKFELSKGD
jgi:cobalt-zinc-cadmium efflux system membrane fusion protein